MKVDRIADEASELYEAGLSIEAVAKELNVAYRTARKAIYSTGVQPRDPSARLVGRTRPDKAAERAEKAVEDVQVVYVIAESLRDRVDA